MLRMLLLCHVFYNTDSCYPVSTKDFSFRLNLLVPAKKYFKTYLLKTFQAITGCGHLIFEILRGVHGKFHSRIETFMPIVLQYLKENKEHQDILFSVLTQTLTDSLQVIQPKEYSIFWNGILKYTEEILSDNDEENKGLEYILRLAGQVIEYQNGRYLTNAPKFVLLLIKVICEQQNENVLVVCAQIGALLLLSPNISLSQEHAGIIVKVLLPLPYPEILISFVQNVISYSQFDMHVLPHFLSFIVQANFENEAVYTLAKICINKTPLSQNGIKLFDWVKYPIDFGNGLSAFMTYLNSVIDVHNAVNTLDDPFQCTNVLICLPHIEKVDVAYCVELLSKFISRLLTIISGYNIEMQVSDNNLHIENTPVSKLIRRMLFLLGHALESAIHISNCKKIEDICKIDNILPILLPYAADPNYLAALNIIDLYLTAYEHENGLSYPFLSLVDSYLKDNVRSPFHLVSIHILFNFIVLNKIVFVG